MSYKKNVAVANFPIGNFINSATGAEVITGAPSGYAVVDGSVIALTGRANYVTNQWVWTSIQQAAMNGSQIGLTFNLANCLPIHYTIATDTVLVSDLGSPLAANVTEWNGSAVGSTVPLPASGAMPETNNTAYMLLAAFWNSQQILAKLSGTTNLTNLIRAALRSDWADSTALAEINAADLALTVASTHLPDQPSATAPFNTDPGICLLGLPGSGADVCAVYVAETANRSKNGGWSVYPSDGTHTSSLVFQTYNQSTQTWSSPSTPINTATGTASGGSSYTTGQWSNASVAFVDNDAGGYLVVVNATLTTTNYTKTSVDPAPLTYSSTSSSCIYVFYATWNQSTRTMGSWTQVAIPLIFAGSGGDTCTGPVLQQTQGINCNKYLTMPVAGRLTQSSSYSSAGLILGLPNATAWFSMSNGLPAGRNNLAVIANGDACQQDFNSCSLVQIPSGQLLAFCTCYGGFLVNNGGYNCVRGIWRNGSGTHGDDGMAWGGPGFKSSIGIPWENFMPVTTQMYQEVVSVLRMPTTGQLLMITQTTYDEPAAWYTSWDNGFSWSPANLFGDGAYPLGTNGAMTLLDNNTVMGVYSRWSVAETWSTDGFSEIRLVGWSNASTEGTYGSTASQQAIQNVGVPATNLPFQHFTKAESISLNDSHRDILSMEQALTTILGDLATIQTTGVPATNLPSDYLTREESFNLHDAAQYLTGIFDGLTFPQIMRGLGALIGGKASASGLGYSAAGSPGTPRISAVKNADGTRIVTLTLGTETPWP